MQDLTREYFERGYAQRWGLAAPSADVRLQAGGVWKLLHLSTEHAGFGVVGVFASPDGSAFDASASPVIWLVGERRGRDRRESK